MTTNPKGSVEDTAMQAPQSDKGDGPIVEFADTPADAPETGERGPEAPPEPQMYFGKYTSMEEAEKAFKEAQRGFHEAKEEASVYRKAIESLQSQPQTQGNMPHTGMGNMDEINEKFRSQLESDTWGTLSAFVRHVYNNERQAEAQRQNAMMGQYKQYASDPQFADVAADVMQQLAYEQNPNVEVAFLKAKLDRLQRGQAVQSATDQVNAQRNFVEPSRGRQSEAEVLRIEMDPEARRVQRAFGLSEDQYRELAKSTAMAKVGGQIGKVPVSIDQWRGRGGKQ